jgi:beta-glucosidase
LAIASYGVTTYGAWTAALPPPAFGDVDPGGRLPVSFPKQLSDVPAHTPEQWPGVDGKVHYSEGLQVGYRWYDAQGIAPQFPFGFGLSYTQFQLSNLQVTPGTLGPGGSVTVSADVRNIGNRSGDDVAQLYVGPPASTGEPPHELHGFQPVSLAAGASRHVTFQLPADDLRTWDTAAGRWTLRPGAYQVLVGSSSRDLPLQRTLAVTGP